MKEDFIFPLNGLKVGRSSFEFHSGKEFFQSFENAEILDADLTVGVTIEKSNAYIGVDLDIQGWVEVTCDRCLAALRLGVAASPALSVKFGEQDSAATEDLWEGEREILFLPESDTDLDLSQVVYDYVCISLPLKRVHAEGECDPDTVKYLADETEAGADTEKDSPVASLKGLLEK